VPFALLDVSAQVAGGGFVAVTLAAIGLASKLVEHYTEKARQRRMNSVPPTTALPGGRVTDGDPRHTIGSLVERLTAANERLERDRDAAIGARKAAERREAALLHKVSEQDRELASMGGALAAKTYRVDQLKKHVVALIEEMARAAGEKPEDLLRRLGIPHPDREPSGTRHEAVTARPRPLVLESDRPLDESRDTPPGGMPVKATRD
jgi:uncharacterized coiled-coil protein SlyX